MILQILYQQCRLRAENKIVPLHLQYLLLTLQITLQSCFFPPFFRCEWVCLIRNISEKWLSQTSEYNFLEHKTSCLCYLCCCCLPTALEQQQISFQYFVDSSTEVLAVYPGFILRAYIGIYDFPTCIAWNRLVPYGERASKGTLFSLHATKASMGHTHIAPVILNLSTSYRYVAFTPKPLYPWGKNNGTHSTGE